jgi:hypothetical protein
MLRNQFRRAVLLGAVAIAAISVSSCETPAPAPAPTPVVVAPPPPPALSVYPRVVEQAAAFEAYMNRAGGITPSFTDGPSIARSLTIAAAYEPRQLATGAIAYGAVAALQDPVFVESVRAYLRNPLSARRSPPRSRPTPPTSPASPARRALRAWSPPRSTAKAVACWWPAKA